MGFLFRYSFHIRGANPGLLVCQPPLYGVYSLPGIGGQDGWVNIYYGGPSCFPPLILGAPPLCALKFVCYLVADIPLRWQGPQPSRVLLFCLRVGRAASENNFLELAPQSCARFLCFFVLIISFSGTLVPEWGLLMANYVST